MLQSWLQGTPADSELGNPKIPINMEGDNESRKHARHFTGKEDQNAIMCNLNEIQIEINCMRSE